VIGVNALEIIVVEISTVSLVAVEINVYGEQSQNVSDARRRTMMKRGGHVMPECYARK
jgi:hypothetical protein